MKNNLVDGNKVFLRPLMSEDAEKTLALRNDKTIKSLALMHPFPVTDELEKEWFSRIINSTKNDIVYFGIIEKSTGDFIGFTSLTGIHWINRTGQYSIVIGEEYQNKGYGTEALNLIIDYAFNNLNLRKIVLEVAAFNESAIKVYLKNGFKEEGRLKKHFFIENNFEDVVIMSLFKQE
jgi:RimJ/RimL family protein N-acetyltransferase